MIIIYFKDSVRGQFNVPGLLKRPVHWVRKNLKKVSVRSRLQPIKRPTKSENNLPFPSSKAVSDKSPLSLQRKEKYEKKYESASRCVIMDNQLLSTGSLFSVPNPWKENIMHQY